LALGRTVEELEEEMTARELAHWGAFERAWGPLTVQERLDYAVAQLAANLASVLTRVAHDPREFLVRWGARRAAPAEEAPRQSPEQIIEMVRRVQRRRRA